ncbi:hypothetical protein GUITHDRAFT_152789, partial [Guillardia theta CCMP2712]
MTHACTIRSHLQRSFNSRADLHSFPPKRSVTGRPQRRLQEATNSHPSNQCPIHLARGVDRFLHGLPPARLPPTCDRCATALDPSAGSSVSHLANCRHRAALWTTAHEQCTVVLRDICVEAGIVTKLHQQGLRQTRTHVPQHGPTNRHMGDLWLLDFTTPGMGCSGSPVGLSALSGPAQQKISDHRASYGTHHPPKAFLPFTAGTDGLLHADALRFLWYLANHHGATLTAEWDGCAQEAVYGDPGFHRLRARLFRQTAL